MVDLPRRADRPSAGIFVEVNRWFERNRLWLAAALAFVAGYGLAGDSVDRQLDDYPRDRTGRTAVCSSDSRYAGPGGAELLRENEDDSGALFHFRTFGRFDEGASPWRIAEQCFSSGVDRGVRSLACAIQQTFVDDDRYALYQTDESGETYQVDPSWLVVSPRFGEDLLFEDLLGDCIVD